MNFDDDLYDEAIKYRFHNNPRFNNALFKHFQCEVLTVERVLKTNPIEMIKTHTLGRETIAMLGTMIEPFIETNKQRQEWGRYLGFYSKSKQKKENQELTYKRLYERVIRTDYAQEKLRLDQENAKLKRQNDKLKKQIDLYLNRND